MYAAPTPGLDYQRLLMASPNAYAVLSRDLRILDANPAWLALANGPPRNYIGRHFFDALPARMQESARDLRALFSRVIERGQADTLPLLHYPLPIAQGNGEGWQDRYWSVSSAPLHDDAGRVAGLLVCPIDITQHVLETEAASDLKRSNTARRASAQMARERQRFRQLMQQAPGFVAVGQGPTHVFELVNNAYYQLVGHRDIIGKPVREALPELAGQGFYELLDQVYASGQPFIGRAMPILLQTEPGAPPVERHIDFIYQPIVDEDARVTGIFVQGHDVTEAHALAMRVSHQAAHDALTGLLNRRDFERRLQHVMDGLRAHDTQHSLLYLDLDHFKAFNDDFGHLAGDRALQITGELLRTALRPQDIAARFGGEEFAVILPGTDVLGARRTAHGARRSACCMPSMRRNGRTGR